MPRNQLMLLTILGVSAWLKIAEAAPSCQVMDQSPENIRINPCAAVVNYPFLLPDGYTVAMLEGAVNAQINDQTLKVLSTGCQNALRNAVCASAYLKCKDGVVIGTTSTYNFQIYANDLSKTFPLPQQRPCRDVCDNVATQCAGERLILSEVFLDGFYMKLCLLRNFFFYFYFSSQDFTRSPRPSRTVPPHTIILAGKLWLLLVSLVTPISTVKV